MAHIFIVSQGYHSSLIRLFALAHQLQEAGHEITFVGKRSIRDYVQEQGFDVITPPAQNKREKTHAGNLVSRWRNRQARLQDAIDELQIDFFDQALESLQPDLLLLDAELPRYIIAASAHEIPFMIHTALHSFYKYPQVPPLHTVSVPGKGLRGSRIGIEWLWLRYRSRKWRRNIRNWFTTGGVDRIAVLREFARQRGFDFKRYVRLYQWLIPFNFVEFPFIHLTLQEFEFPHTAPPNHHYVGQLVQSQRREIYTVDARMINDILATHAANKGQRKLIYCTFGSYVKDDDIQFWKQIISAIEAESQWTLILGLGNRVSVEELGDLPENVYAAAWVPQLDVLDQADCVICHGGTGTVYEAIWTGVPMLVYPFDKLDQPGMASRIAYHQIGIFGNRDRDDSATIRRYLHDLLDESTYQDNILQMQHTLRSYHEQRRAVQVIEEMLKTHQESGQ